MTCLTFGMEETDPMFHPPEDSYSYDAKRGIFIVADGVTRERDEAGNYPVPSPAKLVSDIFCRIAFKALCKDTVTIADIVTAFEEANVAIKNLNDEIGLSKPTYDLRSDLAGCVGGIAIKPENSTQALWGYIGDCGVAVVGPGGNIKFRTPDDYKKAWTYFPDYTNLSPSGRRLQHRRNFRNNPEAGQPAYGILTGEASALSFVRTGQIDLEEYDTLLVYSDGASDILNDEKLRKCLLASKEVLRQQIMLGRQEGLLQDEITLLASGPLLPQKINR